MEMCPNCNVEMEDNAVGLDQMTEGQMADYDAGFGDKQCPICGFQIEG